MYSLPSLLHPPQKRVHTPTHSNFSLFHLPLPTFRPFSSFVFAPSFVLSLFCTSGPPSFHSISLLLTASATLLRPLRNLLTHSHSTHFYNKTKLLGYFVRAMNFFLSSDYCLDVSSSSTRTELESLVSKRKSPGLCYHRNPELPKEQHEISEREDRRDALAFRFAQDEDTPIYKSFLDLTSSAQQQLAQHEPSPPSPEE